MEDKTNIFNNILNYEFKTIPIASKDDKTGNYISKDYIPVNQRILAFRKYYPNYRIETDIVSIDNNHIIMKACIKDENGNIVSTGFSEKSAVIKKYNKEYPNRAYIEKCETACIGRALAMFGIGIVHDLASYEEMEDYYNSSDLSHDNYSKKNESRTQKEYTFNPKEKTMTEKKKAPTIAEEEKLSLTDLTNLIKHITEAKYIKQGLKTIITNHFPNLEVTKTMSEKAQLLLVDILKIEKLEFKKVNDISKKQMIEIIKKFETNDYKITDRLNKWYSELGGKYD